MNKQRILITGVSGLIGRILFGYFSTCEEYEVFGLDQHLHISSRYDNRSEKIEEIEKKYPLSQERFFQCDITDRIELYRILEEQQIRIIIHLAALLETHPNLEQISHVNIQGTKNIFEARKFEKYSSRISFVWSISSSEYRSNYLCKFCSNRIWLYST